MSDPIIAHTVAELIAALSSLPPDAVVHASEPPFTGVAVIPEPENTAVFVASLRDVAESPAEPPTRLRLVS